MVQWDLHLRQFERTTAAIYPPPRSICGLKRGEKTAANLKHNHQNQKGIKQDCLVQMNSRSARIHGLLDRRVLAARVSNGFGLFILSGIYIRMIMNVVSKNVFVL